MKKIELDSVDETRKCVKWVELYAPPPSIMIIKDKERKESTKMPPINSI